MFMHPNISVALAEQHRRDLAAQADAWRLARATRSNSSSRSQHTRRPVNLSWPAITAAAAAAVAALAMVLLTLAGSAHASAGHYLGHYRATYASADHYRDHYRATYASADHYRDHYRATYAYPQRLARPASHVW
jgi:malonyl CoA-acyl carrier protein transacylase